MSDEKYQILRMQVMEKLLSDETLAASGGSCVSVLSVVMGAADLKEGKDGKLAAAGSCVSVISVVMGAEMRNLEIKR